MGDLHYLQGHWVPRPLDVTYLSFMRTEKHAESYPDDIFSTSIISPRTCLLPKRISVWHSRQSATKIDGACLISRCKPLQLFPSQNIWKIALPCDLTLELWNRK